MRRRPLLAALAVLAAACLLAPPAAPAQSGAAAQPGFAIGAVGFESYFRYTLRPGAEQRGRVRLASVANRSRTVVLRPADVTTAATGGLEYGSRAPTAVGGWIQPARRTVRITPGRAVEVPFTIRVPASARPGDHLGGIVAINRAQLRDARRRSGREGFSLRFLPRLAIAVHVTIPGRANAELTVGNIGVDVSPTTTDVTLLIRNTGRKLIPETGGDLTVRRGDRVLLRRKVDLDAFVPGTSITYRLPLTGVPARGTYRVTGELRPQGADVVSVDGTATFEEKQARELEQETGREPSDDGPSTLSVVVIAVAALALLGMTIALVRMRRRLAEVRAAAERRPPGAR